MPISPNNRSRYPVNWEEIRQRILTRAGNCCERCGVRNGVVYCRLVEHPEVALPVGVASMVCGATPGKAVKIVLTIAHINHSLDDHRDEALAAWCQRCHLLHDKGQHAENAAATRAAKKGPQLPFEEAV